MVRSRKEGGGGVNLWAVREGTCSQQTRDLFTCAVEVILEITIFFRDGTVSHITARLWCKIDTQRSTTELQKQFQPHTRLWGENTPIVSYIVLSLSLAQNLVSVDWKHKPIYCNSAGYASKLFYDYFLWCSFVCVFLNCFSHTMPQKVQKNAAKKSSWRAIFSWFSYYSASMTEDQHLLKNSKNCLWIRKVRINVTMNSLFVWAKQNWDS